MVIGVVAMMHGVARRKAARHTDEVMAARSFSRASRHSGFHCVVKVLSVSIPVAASPIGRHIQSHRKDRVKLKIRDCSIVHLEMRSRSRPGVRLPGEERGQIDLPNAEYSIGSGSSVTYGGPARTELGV